MKSKLKVAVLGMGNMGRSHADNVQKMADTELVALCSSPIDDARNYIAGHGISARAYDDFYEMLEKEEIQVLYICLPPFAHNGQLEAAAARHINIFIEKPVAMDMERAESMLRAVKQAGVHTQVGYQMRFGGAVQKLKALIDSGVTGKATLYTANYECNSLHGPWWRDVTKCGGQVFEQVIHLYDMALYIMGKARVVSGHVANLCHQEVENYTVEDTSISNILFENGSLGSISGSNCAVKNQWNGRFRIVFEHMIADFQDQNHAVFIDTREDQPQIEEVSLDVDVTLEEDTYFFDVIRGKQPPFATLAEGCQGLAMVSGVVASSKKDGCTITLSI